MNALKVAGIVLLQIVMGPCAGPVGLLSTLALVVAGYLSWGKSFSPLFGMLLWGHAVGFVVGLTVWYEANKKSKI